jgi:HSP20 family protein
VVGGLCGSGIGQPPRAGYGRRAKDSVQVTLEQRVLSMRGRRDVSLPGDLAPRYLDYEPGNYERAFTLSGAVDPPGIEEGA